MVILQNFNTNLIIGVRHGFHFRHHGIFLQGGATNNRGIAVVVMVVVGVVAPLVVLLKNGFFCN